MTGGFFPCLNFYDAVPGIRAVDKHMGVWMIPTKAPSDEGAVSRTG